MQSNFKKYWLISLLSFYSLYVIDNLIIPLIDDWCVGWWDGRFFQNPTNLWSTLFFTPLICSLFAALTYYFVYKRENRYALKLTTVSVFLLTILTLYRFYSYAHYDWAYTGCPIAIMVQQALLIYTGIFYFGTTFYWYNRVSRNKSIIALIGSTVASIILILTNSILGISLGFLTILYFCLPDSIQNFIEKRVLDFTQRIGTSK